MAPKPIVMSAAERASTPAVSSGGLNGTMPSVDQRPAVGRIPALPVIEAGMRTEPAVSEPIASRAEPSHRLTPAPELDPPGERCTAASHGLRGAPQCGLTPSPP